MVTTSKSLDKKKMIIESCLDTFVRNGYDDTSIRKLASNLNMQVSHIYYYFKDKEELVVACAEMAACTIEETLFSFASDFIKDPENLINKLLCTADLLASTMKFFTSICITSQYKDLVKPVIDHLVLRYEEFAKVICSKLKCDLSEFKPYVFMAIIAVSNYMIYSNASLAITQLTVVKNKIIEVMNKKSK